MDDDRYWPFDVLPPDQRTPLHWEQIAFMEAAHRAGFRPHMFGCENFGATYGNRTGYIIRRTRQFWELMLFGPAEGRLAAYVGGFEVNGSAVLAWLRGVPLADAFEFVRPHLVRAGGRRAGGRRAGFSLEPPERV